MFLDHKSRWTTLYNAPLLINTILNWGQLSVRGVSKFNKFRIDGISFELPVIEDTLNSTHIMYSTGERYISNCECAWRQLIIWHQATRSMSTPRVEGTSQPAQVNQQGVHAKSMIHLGTFHTAV